MMQHSDPNIPGVQKEQKGKRSACDWPVDRYNEAGKVVGQKPCGSEERIYTVTGHGFYTGRSRQTPICEKHLPEAIKKWNWKSAEPIRPL